MIDHQHLRLFQFCDSQFPTGAFSHSFGLETYIQREAVHDTETFIKWLHLFINAQLFRWVSYENCLPRIN